MSENNEFEIENGILIKCNIKNNHCVEIPDNVTRIDNLAFCNCKMITNVIIPNSVTSIG